MQSPQEPTDAQRSQRSGVRLRLDLASKPFIKRQSRVAGRIGRLAIQVLRCAGSLIYDALDLAFAIARNTSKTFFDLAADVFGSACYSIFIHDCFLKS
jgi:hypothetical protein